MDIRAAEISSILKDQIENFGVDDMQKLQIIYLLSISLENREALEKVSSISKSFLGSPLEEAEKTQLEV